MSTEAAEPHTHIRSFNPDRVGPMPNQPRKRFRRIEELADSIREVGQLQPGIVQLVTDDLAFDAELVDGERRLRACKLAGVKFRAEVRAHENDDERFAASFAANFGKQDHDVIEIAEGLARLHKSGKTIEQLGKIAGKKGNWAASHLNLLKLHPEVQAMMVPEDYDVAKLTLTTAQLLVPITDAKKQIALAKKIVKGDMGVFAARRMILKERHQAGDKKVYRNADSRGRKRSIESIESILQDTSDQLGVYVDMPGPELAAMIDLVDNRDKVLLTEKLEDLRETLECLVISIRQRLPKAGRRVA